MAHESRSVSHAANTQLLYLTYLSQSHTEKQTHLLPVIHGETHEPNVTAGKVKLMNVGDG